MRLLPACDSIFGISDNRDAQDAIAGMAGTALLYSSTIRKAPNAVAREPGPWDPSPFVKPACQTHLTHEPRQTALAPMPDAWNRDYSPSARRTLAEQTISLAPSAADLSAGPTQICWAGRASTGPQGLDDGSQGSDLHMRACGCAHWRCMKPLERWRLGGHGAMGWGAEIQCWRASECGMRTADSASQVLADEGNLGGLFVCQWGYDSTSYSNS